MHIGNKTTTKTVERLWSIEEIRTRCAEQDPIELAKAYARKLTIAEKEVLYYDCTNYYFEIEEEDDYDKVFYNDRWINEDNLEQHLIVTYSIKYRNYQRTIRERQVERVMKYVGHHLSLQIAEPMTQNDLLNRGNHAWRPNLNSDLYIYPEKVE